MTIADWYTLIEANPADWDQRLVFSDWLAEQGENVLANGQRWQAQKRKYPCFYLRQSNYWDIYAFYRNDSAGVHNEHRLSDKVLQSSIRFGRNVQDLESWLAHRLAELGIVATGVRA